MRGPRSWAGWLLVPLAMAAVLVHLTLGAVGVVEYVGLAWLFSEPYELTAVTVVIGSVVLGIVGALRVAWPTARAGRALKRLVQSSVRPVPASVLDAADESGVAGRVDVVAIDEAFAVTHGLLRPRILLSTGLLDALDRAELIAVLVHERHHVWRRDPLRLLAARLLAAYGWFLPSLRWWAQGSSLRRELAADQAATAVTGVAAVAGALLKLSDRPAPAALVAVNPTGNLPDRIAQLEGRPPARRATRGWLLAGATLANLAGLTAAAICCAGLGVVMVGGIA